MAASTSSSRATRTPRSATNGSAAQEENASVGQLLGEISRDLSQLMRQEIELAKVELKEEAVKAGKGVGMFGGAGFGGYLVVVFLSLAAMFGIASGTGLGWAALIVAAAWAVIAAVLALAGKKQMKRVSPKPERTIETLKEDAQWARHPTS
jgi:uncharacterized membrane protein YqjE